MTGGRRGGIALPAALAALVVSSALAGAVATVTRVEVLIARHRRTAALALAAADACLARLLAALPPGWDFAAATAGPDGVPGTGDDGVLVAPAGCAGTASATGAGASRLVMSLEGRTAGGRRALAAVAGRAPSPGPPALLWLSAPPVDGIVVGELALDGADRLDPTAVDAAGLAAPGEPEALDAWGRGTAVSATPRTGAALYAAAPPLDALLARVAATGAGAVVGGTPASPTVTLVDGDLVVATPLLGAGLLAVEGVLDVQGSLDFSGVVVATRGIRVAGGARLTIDGVLWVGPGGVGEDPGSVLRVDGALALRQSRTAVAAADRLLPLPRLAILLGLRDLAS